jgi:hypothetical protein
VVQVEERSGAVTLKVVEVVRELVVNGRSSRRLRARVCGEEGRGWIELSPRCCDLIRERWRVFTNAY